MYYASDDFLALTARIASGVCSGSAYVVYVNRQQAPEASRAVSARISSLAYSSVHGTDSGRYLCFGVIRRAMQFTPFLLS